MMTGSSCAALPGSRRQGAGALAVCRALGSLQWRCLLCGGVPMGACSSIGVVQHIIRVARCHWMDSRRIWVGAWPVLDLVKVW